MRILCIDFICWGLGSSQVKYIMSLILFLASLGIYKLDFHSCTLLVTRFLLLLHVQFCCHLTSKRWYFYVVVTSSPSLPMHGSAFQIFKKETKPRAPLLQQVWLQQVAIQLALPNIQLSYILSYVIEVTQLYDIHVGIRYRYLGRVVGSY